MHLKNGPMEVPGLSRLHMHMPHVHLPRLERRPELDALRGFCKPAAGVCVLGGGLRVRFGPAGGAALHTRMGSESRKCARPPVETIAQDLRLSPADAGA